MYATVILNFSHAAGAAAAADQALAVVPDANRPFTITMHNPKDGLDYVVAHYEPQALQHCTLSSSSSNNSSSSTTPAANLCEIFNSRKKALRMQRVSAEDKQLMGMAGTRIPAKGGGASAHFGRYHDDVGECQGMRQSQGKSCMVCLSHKGWCSGIHPQA
jgi:hypothetical protein